MQNGVSGMGDYRLFPDTSWAIELSVGTTIPEWNSQETSMALEQDAAFTARGIQFLDGRQARFHLIPVIEPAIRQADIPGARHEPSLLRASAN